MQKKAIFLSGGGARGAYQVGVLKGISDIIKTDKLPVEIISSVSAGAINASFLAMYAHDFSLALSKLIELWSSLSFGKIYRVGNFSLIKSVLRNVFSMILHIDVKGGGYLLDTTPLKTLLNSHLDFHKINSNIEQGLLSDFEVAASCYDLPESTSFFKSNRPIPCWEHTRHTSCSTDISCKHILASSAIPLFFPAVEINQLHYGDGGVRLGTPLRASIQLGADRILVIGTRRVPLKTSAIPAKISDISFAKVLGYMLNALFLDNLDKDVQLLRKINDSINLMSPDQKKESKLKSINALYIYPSKDLGGFTKGMQKNMPLLLRYLMSGFGSKDQSGDLLSFLLFESEYCKQLIDVGYDDAMAQKNDIEEFFSH